MILERDILRFSVGSDASLREALERIGNNKMGVVCIVDEKNKLQGVLTDGDVRRWLMSSPTSDLSVCVSAVGNKDFFRLDSKTTYEEIQQCFNDRISIIPLVDEWGHLISLAINQPSILRIGEFVIGRCHPTFFIAEVGNNHNGDIRLAKRLVDEAVNAGADCVKFQMRNMRALYGAEDMHLKNGEDLGSEYTLDLLSRFQLPRSELFEVFDYCKERGALPLCTPWDLVSLEELDAYGMVAFKIASADLTNHELITAAVKTGKPLIISTGMSQEHEIQETVNLLKRMNAQYVMLHCNSTYPAPFKDINLNYLARLEEIGEGPVGYSGHERGIAIAIGAVAKGARVIEKHITLDRDMEGNDHRVSLLPLEFSEMITSVRQLEQALGSAEPRRLSQGELMNREVLGKSLVINQALKAGERISDSMIEVRSPGRGLSPNRRAELVGKIARRDLKSGEFFFPSDLEGQLVEPRPYKFRRPYGIPVRYHDFKRLIGSSSPDLVEFHLSYKDLDEDPEQYLDGSYDLDFVVHSPELFAGDHVMDLSAADAKYRERSLLELQRVVDVTRRMKSHFRSLRPQIVINAGGFSMNDFIDWTERERRHEQIARSLQHIDANGVEIILQTMPPFPWHFGGQRFHNLIMMPEDIDKFCRSYGYRICLDISHSKLASNHFGISFKSFLEMVSEHVAHMHVVDAIGVDGEGLQIGCGNVDFELVADVLDRKAPHASFIPEIWQGHKNGGEGFWFALDRLEQWF